MTRDASRAGADGRVPRVSVVVPTRNRAPLLRETLASLVAQTERDLEIVVVDNASTDGTAALVRQMNDPRLRLATSDTPLPQMANWTRALASARGDYVALYHDDDLYDARIVERSRALLDAHPAVGLVHVGARRFASDGRDLGPWRAARRDFVRAGREEALRWIRDIHDVVPSSIMLRRTVSERVGGFVPDLLCADFDLFVRMALAADVGFIAGPLLRVRVHGPSTTATMAPERWVAEVERLVPRFRAHLAAAGVAPPEGWAAVERRLRGRFARRLWRLELSLIACGEHARARDARAASQALDAGSVARAAGAALTALNRPTLVRALGWARAVGAAGRAARRRLVSS